MRAVGRSVVRLPGPWSLHRRHSPTRMSEVRDKQSIHHFHIDHNAPCLQQKLWITIVFDFSWDDCNTLENFETMVMQNSKGETRCIMVYVQVVITRDVKCA